ncbi:Transmembrane protein 17A [Blattella germanica]|nr:Transmembrane protein 17A [Blattella germanica]
MLHLKYECLSHTYSFIVVTVLVAIIGIKLLRLYIGCMGNLTEKFPLQLLLLVNENTKLFQMEHAVQGIMLSFLVVQIFSGSFAVRHASQHQANFFHRMQSTSPSVLTNQYQPSC